MTNFIAESSHGKPNAELPGEIIRPGVSSDYLRAQKIRHVDRDEASELLGFPVSCGGIWIPYYDPFKPGPLLVNNRPFGRLRLDRPTSDAKYLSLKDSGAQLYFPINAGGFERELPITEGEIKALSLCEAGVHAVSIGGISSSMCQGKLIPDLQKLFAKWQYIAVVYFLGDNDTALNFEFSREAVKLARALPERCVLKLPRIPITMPKGIDDCRAALNSEFPAFWEKIKVDAYTVDRKLDPCALALRLATQELPAIATFENKEVQIQNLVELGSYLDPLHVDLLAKAASKDLGLSVVAFRKNAEQAAKERKASNAQSAREASSRQTRRETSEQAPPTSGMPQVTFPPRDRRPIFVCYDEAFVVEGRVLKAGVYYHYIENSKDGLVEELIDRWICSPLKVLCIVRASAGNEHGYLAEYVQHGESSLRRTVLSQALLLGRPEEPLKALRDIGVSVLHENLRFVRDYLDKEQLRFSTQTPDDFWQSIKTVGWSPAPDCFVLPNEIIGNQSRVWFSGRCEAALYTKAGTIEEWKDHIAALCVGNPFLIFAVSAAFSGPLLELCNIPGIGFHLYGDSTNGKTTTLAAAVSVWGPSPFMLTWRSTTNGLEIQAALRSSTLIALDESHMIDGKALDASIYLLANGVSKSRMTKDIAAREVARWRVCVLSSGERSIESHLGAAKIDHKVGQGIRIADVPVSGSFGLFNDLHERKDGSVFSDEIRSAAAQYYGHAGPLFVQRLIDAGPAIAPGSALAAFLPRFGDDLSAQEQRVARAFALAALAGELATAKDIVPWREGEALNAAVEIFDLWRAAQPRSPRGKEYAQVLTGVREFIEVHGADFSDSEWMPEVDLDISRIVNAEPVIRERAGYWKDITADKRIYMFNADGLKRASSGFGVGKVIQVLEAAGALRDRDEGRRTKKTWIPQLKRHLNFYWVDPEKLELAS